MENFIFSAVLIISSLSSHLTYFYSRGNGNHINILTVTGVWKMELGLSSTLYKLTKKNNKRNFMGWLTHRLHLRNQKQLP